MKEAADAAAGPSGSCDNKALDISAAAILNESTELCFGVPSNLVDDLKLDKIGDSNWVSRRTLDHIDRASQNTTSKNVIGRKIGVIM